MSKKKKERKKSVSISNLTSKTKQSNKGKDPKNVRERTLKKQKDKEKLINPVSNPKVPQGKKDSKRDKGKSCKIKGKKKK